jgi:signal transduction histidine kinase
VTRRVVSADDAPDPDRLADEQSALRRVATLVARGVPPAEIFDAVAKEVHRLLRAHVTVLVRFDPDGLVTVVATCGHETDVLGVGVRWHPSAASPSLAEVLSGRPTRVDAYHPTGSWLDSIVGAEGMVAWVASPIVLMGRPWGAFAAVSRQRPLPAGAEERLADFSELVGTAIANAESRAELMASRARTVSAADEARHRIQRDLHDGAQQRVVTLAVKLKMLAASDVARVSGLDADVLELVSDVEDALNELRDISRGLHPAMLSRHGLKAAIKALAERSAIPVALDLGVSGRLAESVEITAYYVVAEMLTNAAKHANASRVEVAVQVRDGALRVCVRDDGVGGADPGDGSGLVGLRERVEAQDGTMTVDSPPGGGTTLVTELPLGEAADSAAARGQGSKSPGPSRAPVGFLKP